MIIAEQPVKGIRPHAESTRVAAKRRQDHATVIGNEAAAADAMAARFNCRSGMKMAGNFEDTLRQ